MGTVQTYTATPCMFGAGTYEVLKSIVDTIPTSNLIVVEPQPNVFDCCTVDRSTVNTTDENSVVIAFDSETTTCMACRTRWVT